MTADLFGAPLIAGLSQDEEFVSHEEEQQLINRIGTVELAPFQFRGFEGKRLTASFGFHYDFNRHSFDEAEPIPDWLLPIKARAEQFAGLSEGALRHVLLIRYDPGAGIGWHRDRPVFDRVVGISLGAPATLAFRRRTASGFDRIKVPLASRSIYVLSGPARHEWEHGISAHDALRYSITFRSLAERR